MTNQSNNVLALAGGAISAIGGAVHLNYAPLFLPPGTKGWMPFQNYVVRDGDQCMIIDTGLPRLADTLRDGLDKVVGQGKSCWVFATRREVETLDNLSWVLRRYDVTKFYFLIGHMIAPLEVVTFFDEAEDAMEISVTEAHIAANEHIPIEWVRKPEDVVLGSRVFVPIRSPIAILSTYWLYEEATGTLFSSDMWGFLGAREDGGPLVTTSVDDVTIEQLEEHIKAKFDLLCGTDTSRVQETLRKIAAERRIERICPSYGLIIEGSDAVGKLIDMTVEAVDRVGKTPKRSLLEEFRATLTEERVA
jgi:hypothetical protein